MVAVMNYAWIENLTMAVILIIACLFAIKYFSPAVFVSASTGKTAKAAAVESEKTNAKCTGCSTGCATKK
jgi:hypothetical protein